VPDLRLGAERAVHGRARRPIRPAPDAGCVSLVIAGILGGLRLTDDHRLLLALAFAHGLFWSGLLSASAAYITELIPPARRAEGIGYWGLSTVLAVAVAPSIGLWLYRGGWLALCVSVGLLNLAMAAIAWHLEPDQTRTGTSSRWLSMDAVEWRVAVVAFTLFLYAFGYGGVTSFSALYAEASGVSPRSIYFTVFALTVVVSRPFSGRLADRVGHVRVLVPCLALVVAGYGLLALGSTRAWFVASAIVFGLGFGSAYPVFAAWIVERVRAERRGAAFGGILASLDTGIGTGRLPWAGSSESYGFRVAFGAAAAVAVLAIPYFLFTSERLLGRREAGSFGPPASSP
jgi:MFS family permease